MRQTWMPKLEPRVSSTEVGYSQAALMLDPPAEMVAGNRAPARSDSAVLRAARSSRRSLAAQLDRFFRWAMRRMVTYYRG